LSRGLWIKEKGGAAENVHLICNKKEHGRRKRKKRKDLNAMVEAGSDKRKRALKWHKWGNNGPRGGNERGVRRKGTEENESQGVSGVDILEGQSGNGNKWRDSRKGSEKKMRSLRSHNRPSALYRPAKSAGESGISGKTEIGNETSIRAKPE